MSKINYKMSVQAIESVSLEGKTKYAFAEEIGRALIGGQDDATWAGNAIAAWTAGVHTVKSSDGSTIECPSSDGVWVKHTGFDFSDGITPNTAEVSVKVSAQSLTIAVLGPGECVFLPRCSTKITLSDNGTAAAVEYAVLT